MSIAKQIAKHLRDVYFGGNWTVSCVKDHLADVTWQEATSKAGSFNTIAVLTFHINYFVVVATRILQGGPLEGKDSESFAHPPICTSADWEAMREEVLNNARIFADLIEQLPDSRLAENFGDSKYGTYYRNLAGIIEHTHYHLGQIVMVKKLVREKSIARAVES